MTATTNRDEAVQILTAFCSKLFTRAWMTWTPRHAAGIARLVDCLIAAAVEQARANQEESFLDDLLVEAPQRPAHPASARTVSYRRDADGDPGYQDYRRRNQTEDVRGILRREGR